MANIELTGNLGSIELKYTPNGRAVLALSVAENHRRKNGDQWQDDGTTWWRVTVWEKQAETLVEALKKGDRVLVVGQVRSREYEKDGDKRTAYDVSARHVALIPKPGNTQQQPAGGQQTDPWATNDTTTGQTW